MDLRKTLPAEVISRPIPGLAFGFAGILTLNPTYLTMDEPHCPRGCYGAGEADQKGVYGVVNAVALGSLAEKRDGDCDQRGEK